MSESQDTALVSFRLIEGFMGYRVGDDGSIWSCRIRCSGKIGSRWKKLKGSPNNGYLRVQLSTEIGVVCRYVQVLVLEAFVGPQPEGMQACHGDGCRSNNRLDNLRWDTPAANEADKELHGTKAKGERQGSAKLTDESVREILRLFDAHISKTEIARRFGVGRTTITRIVEGAAWKHV